MALPLTRYKPPMKSSKELTETVYENLLMTLASFSGPWSKVVPAVTDAVLGALQHDRIVREARPFISEVLAKASGPGKIVEASVPLRDGSFRHGFLRQVKKTVKYKKRPSISYVDSKGLEIPETVARDSLLI